MPNLPDNLFKIIFVIGLFLFGYFFLQQQNNDNKYNASVEDLNVAIDSLNLKVFVASCQHKKTLSTANRIATMNGIKNPITQGGDSMYVLNLIVRKDKEFLDSTFEALFDQIKDANFNLSVQEKMLEEKRERLNYEERKYEAGLKYNLIATVIGGFLIMAGFLGILREQLHNQKMAKGQLKEKGLLYDHCQSCGRKFSSIREHGLRLNGEVNYAFCKQCYHNGCFTEPDLTIDELLNRADADLNFLGKGKKARFRKRFRRLERWKTNEY